MVKRALYACHPNYQVLIIFRMSLSVQKGLTAHYIKLHMHTLLIEKGTDQSYEFLKAFHSTEG